MTQSAIIGCLGVWNLVLGLGSWVLSLGSWVLVSDFDLSHPLAFCPLSTPLLSSSSSLPEPYSECHVIALETYLGKENSFQLEPSAMFCFQKRTEHSKPKNLREFESNHQVSKHHKNCNPYDGPSPARLNCRILRPSLKALGDPLCHAPLRRQHSTWLTPSIASIAVAVLGIVSGIGG